MPTTARVAVIACAAALAHGIKDAFGRREGLPQRLTDCASGPGATTTPEPYVAWFSDGTLKETPPPPNAFDLLTDVAPLWARTATTGRIHA